jgi:hypothetical protein
MTENSSRGIFFHGSKSEIQNSHVSTCASCFGLERDGLFNVYVRGGWCLQIWLVLTFLWVFFGVGASTGQILFPPRNNVSE